MLTRENWLGRLNLKESSEFGVSRIGFSWLLAGPIVPFWLQTELRISRVVGFSRKVLLRGVCSNEEIDPVARH
jgi:hypothetical protein